MTSPTRDDLYLAATLIKIRTSPIIDLNYAEDDLNFAQLVKTSNSVPPILDAPSTSKQRKLKSSVFEGSQIDVQKEHPPHTISTVYIFKANNDSSEAGHIISLMNLEAHTEQTTPGKLVYINFFVFDHLALCLYSVNNSEERGREVLERSEPSKTNLLQDVKSFLDFHIMFEGLCIDHELSEDVRVCYYKLCIYKKQWLHDGVSKDFCGVVVARMIGETVRIANEIKNCTMTTSKEDFGSWDKSLSSFEKFGMKVRFLRHKIHMLETLVFQSEGAVDVKRYEEAKEEHKRVKDEIKIVSAELTQLKKTANKFEEVTSGLKQKIEEFENKFGEEIDAL
ncbi:uncharacterized protein LOC143610957 [Bidens hawaiensis]|uniref:uncharacterized protein LOC143610957 n=1 Tax=Bidens hawaiensis TaxID=980011 RepID=UPI00404B6EC1